jgi:hypothetical protein
VAPEAPSKRDKWEIIIKQYQEALAADPELTKIAFSQSKDVSVHKFRYWYSTIVKGKAGSHFGKFPYTITKYPKALVESFDKIRDDIILGIAKGDLPVIVNKVLSTTTCLNCDSKKLELTSSGRVIYKCEDCDYVHFLPLRKAGLSAIGSRAHMGSGTIVYMAVEVLKAVMEEGKNVGEQPDSGSD